MRGARWWVPLLVGVLLAPLAATADEGLEVLGVLGARNHEDDAVETSLPGAISFVDSDRALLYAVGRRIRERRLADDAQARTLGKLSPTQRAIACALSPDRRTLVIATAGVTTLSLVDARTFELVGRLPGVDGPVVMLAWSPRGDRVLAASTIGEASVASVASGQRVASASSLGVVLAAGFVGEEAAVFHLAMKGRVVVWRPEGSEEAGRFTIPADPNRGAVSLDGETFASVHGTTLVVRRWKKDEVIWRQDLKEQCVSSLALSSDGRRVAFAGASQCVRSFLLGEGETTPKIGFTGPVSGISLSPDGQRAVSSTADGLVHVWDVARERCLGRLPCGVASGPVAFTADGEHILVATALGIEVILPQPGRLVRRLEGATAEREIALVGSTVRGVGAAGVATWLLDGGPPRIEAGEGLVRALGGGKAVALREVKDGGRFALVNLATGTARVSSTTTDGRVTSVSFSADSRRALVVAGANLEVWDTERLERVATFESCPLVLGAVGVSPDGERGLALHADRKLRLWRLDGTWAEASLDWSERGVPSAFAFGRGEVLVGTTDGRIHRVALPGRK